MSFDVKQKAQGLQETIENMIYNKNPRPYSFKHNYYKQQSDLLEYILADELLKLSKQEAEDIAWAYFFKAPWSWHGCSSKLNIYTQVHICDENDESGYPKGTILHYTHTSTLYCTSNDTNEDDIPYGSNPIEYYGEFNITRQNFELYWPDLELLRKIKFIPKLLT
jgi:hypothetical protein